MKRELSPWGKRCKVQMIELGKSLNDVGRETGFSKSYISAVINGRVVVPDETIAAISRVLQVDAELYSTI